MTKKKQSVRSINHLNMADFFNESEEAVSGAELLKDFNAKAKLPVPMAWAEFHALVSRDCCGSYQMAGDGYAAFKLELKGSFSVPSIGDEAEQEEEE